MDSGFLRVKGQHIVDEKGDKVFLRGVCLGGWLNMENFITGYPGAERTLRKAVRDELGEERYRAFFTSFLDSFITEEDFAFLAGLGATVVRIPFNYRHFESDLAPGEYDPAGFLYLDKAISWARKHGLYVILDLHAAPGWQNQGWHSDNPYGISLLWGDRHCQERIRNLWVYIASHYKDEPQVAGYNLLNEPNAPGMDILNKLYREWTEAVRTVDRRHIVFVEGNRYSQIFEGLEEPFDENLVYSSHNYTPATHTARRYPGEAGGEYVDAAWMERAFLERNGWILKRRRPSWIGEFGALFDGPADAPTQADLARLAALRDQLAVFNRHEQHWTIWTYKDVGAQGLVVPWEESEYMRRIRPFLAFKRRLGLDPWTARGRGALIAASAGLIEVLAQAAAEELCDYSLDSRALAREFVESAVSGKLANAVAPLYAARFAEMSGGEIEKMHQEAFAFSHCRRRPALIEVLREALRG